MPRKKNKVVREVVTPKGRANGWSDEERQVACELVRLGVKGSRIAPFLMQRYKTKRTPHGVWSLTWKHKADKIPQSIRDLVKSEGLVAKAMAFDVMKQPTGLRRRRKAQLAVEASVTSLAAAAPPEGLSKAAQKALEAKLVVHRFRLETPNQSIELAVSGQDAATVFARLVAATAASK